MSIEIFRQGRATELQRTCQTIMWARCCNLYAGLSLACFCVEIDLEAITVRLRPLLCDMHSHTPKIQCMGCIYPEYIDLYISPNPNMMLPKDKNTYFLLPLCYFCHCWSWDRCCWYIFKLCRWWCWW